MDLGSSFASRAAWFCSHESIDGLYKDPDAIHLRARNLSVKSFYATMPAFIAKSPISKEWRVAR